ncbi:KR domain-containing protein [Mycena vitilis]|nr:KR domain-containing protein [Mycena vitilis]
MWDQKTEGVEMECGGIDGPEAGAQPGRIHFLTYTVTDISYALVANLADTISHGSVVPKAYDISQDPDTQDIHPNSYDIIVALHTLHVAPIVETSLVSLQNLLIPGGSLLIVELDGSSWSDKSGSVWFDCVFGSFPEWFGYADGREHCSMAPVAWKRQLESLDLVNVQTCAETGDNGRDFFFVAHKHSSGSLSVAQPPIDSQHIHTYQIGSAMELRNALVIHDSTASITVYILALQGRDADSAVGLCATLRKEFQCWDIRLGVFESATQLSHPIPLLSRHAWAFVGGQNAVSFDQDGHPHVLRLVVSSPPPASVSSAESRVPEHPDSIEVRISEWARMSDRYDGFIGYAISAHASGISVGDFVGGIAAVSSSQIIRVPVGNMVPLTKDPTLVLPADILSAILIPFIDTPSSTPVRILIALENRTLAARLEQHVSNMPPLELLVADFTSPDAFRPVDILFSDSRTYTAHPHLRRWVRRAGKAVIWDDLLKVAIGQDRLYAARILAKARLPSPDLATIGTALQRTPSVLPRGCAPPFRADRAYVLLGGISWLGVDLAVWLYQHGARHLLLTSRQGIACLDGAADAMTLAKILYLRSQPELSLQLEQCDATDEDAMRVLLHSLLVPIAGCFHMPVILRDAPFVDQTHESFMAAHDCTLGCFGNLSNQVPMSALDFFVGISSVAGLIGLNGQSNYASACTALEGALAQYPNAFTLIVPKISEDESGGDNSGSVSAKDIWAWLEDGLRKLDAGPFNRYIPDWNWNWIDARFGLPLAYKHLVSRSSRSSTRSTGLKASREEILRPVLNLLEISENDFDVLQPLTVYGLDSISAARLSTLLEPHASFSQMQLLGGVAWADIDREIQSAAGTDKARDAVSATDILLNLLDVPPGEFSPDIPLSSYGLESLGAARLASALQPFMAVTQMQLMGETTWSELLRSMDIEDHLSPSSQTEPLVEICSGSGTPLIILPGATGSVLPFFGLRGGSQGPVWAIQITESTPLESLSGLVAFWKDKICEKRPHGPYHLVAYSASVLSGVILAKLMEDADEIVEKLVFIDNSPLLWTRKESEALLREKSVTEFQDMIDRTVLDMLYNDPHTGPEAVPNYEAALRNLPDALASIRREIEISRAVMGLIFQFLHQFYPQTEAKSQSAFVEAFRAWVSSVNAPMVILAAEHGILHSAPGGAWPDLGASRFGKAVAVHHLTGVGHFGLFADERLAQMLWL